MLDMSNDEKELYNERIAICMYDGGLDVKEARKVARAQIIERRYQRGEIELKQTKLWGEE